MNLPGRQADILLHSPLHVETAFLLLSANTNPSRQAKVNDDLIPQFFDTYECLHFKSTNVRLFFFKKFLVTKGFKAHDFG